MQKCFGCGTYFSSNVQCPRCEFVRNRKRAGRLRQFFAERPGAARKPGDGEVQLVRLSNQRIEQLRKLGYTGDGTRPAAQDPN